MFSLTEKCMLSVGILTLAISATKNNYLSKWENDLSEQKYISADMKEIVTIRKVI